MSYGEWCPNCGAEIVAVTRGIPSMGTCENGHITDRRDTLRRKPDPAHDLAAQVVKLTEALNESDRLLAHVYAAYLSFEAGAIKHAPPEKGWAEQVEAHLAAAEARK